MTKDGDAGVTVAAYTSVLVPIVRDGAPVPRIGPGVDAGGTTMISSIQITRTFFSKACPPHLPNRLRGISEFRSTVDAVEYNNYFLGRPEGKGNVERT
jgi:hypothetical protein